MYDSVLLQAFLRDEMNAKFFFRYFFSTLNIAEQDDKDELMLEWKKNESFICALLLSLLVRI